MYDNKLPLYLISKSQYVTSGNAFYGTGSTRLHTKKRNIRLRHIQILCKLTCKHTTFEKSTAPWYQSQKMWLQEGNSVGFILPCQKKEQSTNISYRLFPQQGNYLGCRLNSKQIWQSSYVKHKKFLQKVKSNGCTRTPWPIKITLQQSVSNISILVRTYITKISQAN